MTRLPGLAEKARPVINAELAGTLTAAIPPRLIKKLDADPTLADKWTWTATSVTTDKGEVVTLVVTDDVITQLQCSCLLNPKCLHVAAVVTLLEPAEGTPGPKPPVRSRRRSCCARSTPAAPPGCIAWPPVRPACCVRSAICAPIAPSSRSRP
jgi:hypothetical protein